MHAWADGETGSLELAWTRCPRGDWLVDIAAHLEVDRRLVVMAASDCVLVALSRPADHVVADSAWDAVQGWLDGDASDARCRATGRAARTLYADLSDRRSPTAEMLAATAELALACDAATDRAAWARERHAANAVAYAVRALFHEDPAAARRVARLVVRRIPFELVGAGAAMTLAAAAPSGVRESPPPPSMAAPRRWSDTGER